MATVTRNSPPQPPPAPPTQQSVANQRFIGGQLRRTSRHVKVVDLFGGMMMFSASVLVFLLFVAIVDAWLFELGKIGRLLTLVVVAVSAVAYVAVYMIPLFFRRVNQEYAARMIEESEPTLKNSLINFLTFQSNMSPAHEVVQSVLEQRAAADLSHVPIESAVDRSKLIKVGYLLAGVMIICALYKVLSPKDPFQTFARIASPFANISRPSRVQITRVEPGDTEVFRGTEVEVTASVDGIGKNDPVTLIYSTDDGQTVDARIPMTIGDGADTYVCQLSTSEDGVQQDLKYRISAGDATTDNYQVTVLASPTIVVEKVELEFPKYTRREKQVIQRQGDVRAMEGTRAKIFCRANHKIKSAHIELNPADGAETSSKVRLKRVEMSIDGFEASGQFVLRLDADRRTPVISSYRVHFVSENNHRNQRPIVHRVEVLADMSPEVEILTPRNDVIEVPENGFTKIEVRAIDPDYGLSRISLRGVVGGTEVLDKTLFKSTTGQLGQTVVNENFRPTAVGLEAGDLLEYWAIAADNRVSARSGKPEPNETRTRPTYYIRVVAPKKEKDPFAEDSEPEGKPKESEVPKDPGSREITDGAKGRSEPSETPRTSEPSDKSTESGDSSDTGSKSGNTAGSTTGSGDSSGESGDNSGKSSSGGSQADGNASEDSSGSSGNSARNSDSSKSGESGNGSTSGGKSDEPLHPGEVFERVLDHLEEQKKKNGESTEGGTTGEKTKPNGGSKSEEGSKPDSSGGSNPKQPNQSGGSGGSDSSSQPGNEKKDGGGSSQSGKNQQQSSGNKSGGEGADSKSSQGGQPQGNGGDQKSGSKSGAGSQQSTQNNGGQSGNKGSKPSQGGGSSQDGGNSGSKPMGQKTQQGGGQKSGGQQSGGQQNGGQGSGRQKPGGQKSSGNEAGGGAGEQQKPVQNGSGQKSGGANKQGGQDSAGKKSAGGGQESGGQNSSGKKQGGEQSGGQESGGQESGRQKTGGQKSGGQESGGQKSGNQNSSGQKEEGQTGGGQSNQSNTGDESGEKKDGSKSGGNKNKTSGGQQSDQKQGKSGGGKPKQSSSGSSGGQKDQQQQKKKQGGGGGEKKEGGAESSGGSKKESGAKGEGQSDRSGAGSQGGGQSAGQPGKGESGGNTPSEDGVGTANEKGQGNPSGQPGDDQTGEKTGRTGSKSGKGSNTRKSQGGSKRTGDPGSQAGGKEGSPFGGGGGQGNTQNTQSKFDGKVSDGDDPDLEYARKATDLALEYLRDQKEKPDRELLDKLNFTDDELRKFVERWDLLKRSAKRSDAPSRRELDESLRSLGLRPSRDTRRSGSATNDNQRFGDSGGTSGPPAKFRDRFNAFIKGTARKSEKE